ncbi:hypothetical protein LNKW23_15420 [Paralimibaculum aggregatum]|uniref:Uncharacterized protein n=1 Tax=Paralimibaculum aggregatum TaxID=3036245 RepID=A0ABQ6LJH1_9RHOB|nr:hypothetical protein [Limibaculum sp. NKW23]GMG82329.1 hypothetical protein LNKW23_15420 [Limibaculum sp. NKW23]
MDLTSKTDTQIQNLIDNHRRAGELKAPLAVAAIDEQARRNPSFDFKAGIAFLKQAAREGRTVTYRQLAEAGGVLKPGAAWRQHMARKIPLSQIVDYAHTHDLPAITALVETTQGVTESILAGFEKGLADNGIQVPAGMSVREFYLAERQRAFDWGASSGQD